MTPADATEVFVRQLTEHQTRIYAYVFSLVGDHSRAADVVQETNLVLWRKLADFNHRQPFLPWALTIARFQVLAHLRDQKRDRMLVDADLAEALSVELESQVNQLDSVREALRPCLRLLTDSNRRMIEQRYFQARSVTEVAETAQRSVGAVKTALVRIRRQLAECVQARLVEVQS